MHKSISGSGALGGLGLDLAAMQLVADPLDLLSDIEIGSAKVDQIPGQAEDFALTQAHDEDQDEGGVQGLTGPAGVFREPAGFIDTPPAALAFARGRQFHHGGDVPADNFLINGAGKRGPDPIAIEIDLTKGMKKGNHQDVGEVDGFPVTIWPDFEDNQEWNEEWDEYDD